MLAKVVNGKLVVPTEAERQKIVITNPSNEMLCRCLGYANVEIDKKPEFDKTTQYLSPVLEKTGEITGVVHWEVVDIPADTEDEA